MVISFTLLNRLKNWVLNIQLASLVKSWLVQDQTVPVSHEDVDVDCFKRFILHRSSINNSASLSNKFGEFYFIVKFGEAYDKVFNHLHAPLEGKCDIWFTVVKIQVAYLYKTPIGLLQKGEEDYRDMNCNLLNVVAWRFRFKGKINSFMEDQDVEDQDVGFVIIK
ncbi:hypothetical protein Tco_1303921 [Tanacetum coccineum]